MLKCLPVHYKVKQNLDYNSLTKLKLCSTIFIYQLTSRFLILSAVLSDFEDASNHLEDDAVKREVNLVADSLRLGGAILGKKLSYDIIRDHFQNYQHMFIVYV